MKGFSRSQTDLVSNWLNEFVQSVQSVKKRLVTPTGDHRTAAGAVSGSNGHAASATSCCWSACAAVH